MASTACSMGKTKLADLLTDPPEHMVGSFVSSVDDDHCLNSLFSILCARLIQVKLLMCISGLAGCAQCSAAQLLSLLCSSTWSG